MPKRKLRILIVEDEPLSQKIVEKLLHDHYHCEVDTAKSATEALNLVNDRAFEWDKKGYNIILMDIYLPDINGDMLTEIIRKTETQTKSTPIIATSGKVSKSDKKIFQEMGVTDLLLKPILFEQLDAMFHKYFDEIDQYKK